MTIQTSHAKTIALIVGGLVALCLLAWLGVIAKHAIPSSLHFSISLVSRLVLIALFFLVIFHESNWTLRNWIKRPTSIALLVCIAVAAFFGATAFSERPL